VIASRYLAALAATVLSSTAGAAWAHHSFSAEFDANRTISVQGVVTEFRLVNPHASMTMNVTDDAGKTTKWEVEFAGRLNLAKGGWTPSTIKPGEQVTVFGNPSHTGTPRIAFRRLVRADGSELRAPSDDAIDAIEQQRRERARERNQGH
jgi:hypothetical protein